MCSVVLTFFILLPDLSKLFMNQSGQWHTGRYFFLIIEGAQVGAELQTQLSKLPGVANAHWEAEEKVKGDLAQIVGKLDLKLPDVLFQNTPQVFKISMGQEMNPRGEKLLQDYIKKIVGPEFVTFSATKDPSPLLQRFQKMIDQLNQIGRWPLIAGCFALWFFAFHYFGQIYFPRVFVVENYQRKKRVGIKGLILFQVVALILGIIITLALGISPQGVHYIQALAIGLLGPCIFMLSRRWSPQFLH